MPTSISLKALIAADACATKEDTRYYLKGVYTHAADKNRIYVATCGAVLVKIEEPKKDNDDGNVLIIGSDTIAMLEKLAKMHDPKKTLWTHEDFLTLHVEGKRHYFKFFNGQSIDFTPVDGTYPDYNRVFPPQADEQKTCICLDPAHIARLAKSYTAYTGKKDIVLQLSFTGDGLAPCFVDTHTANFTGLLVAARDINASKRAGKKAAA